MIDFHNDLDPDLRLHMDPDDFGEVIGNLIDNARKFARSHVRVSARLDGDAAEIMVADDGPGIAVEMRQNVLQRGETSADSDGGTGLGLAIVRDILAEYDSNVEISAAPEGGALLSFKIRAAKRPA